MSKSNVKPVALAVCTALGGLALSATAFASQELASGYMASASAGHGEKAKGEGSCGMDKVDTDKDGKVSQTEFTTAHPDKAADFAAMDANSDGFIDAEELKAHKAEGKCGGEKKDGEGKCGEGKCGGAA